MSDVASTLGATRAQPTTVPAGVAWSAPDGRRILQLALAAVWLLDAILQLQSYFFTRSFGLEMLGPTARGNPAVVAHPISWAAQTIEHHPVPANAVFALTQLLIALGIAWRPTLKPALVLSIIWSLGVWWVGEGLGRVLTGDSNPVSGAPGAVLLYVVLAVLLWPTERSGSSTPPFIAARAVGERAAKVIWLVLWGFLGSVAILGSSRSADGLHRIVGELASGEPGWLARTDHYVASLLAQRGVGVSIVLAVLLGIVAVGVYLPSGAARVTTALGIVLAVLIWVFGENFGEIFTHSATDPNSGPLLILLGFAYWRGRSRSSAATSRGSDNVVEPRSA
jgi:hypothetical protein